MQKGPRKVKRDVLVNFRVSDAEKAAWKNKKKPSKKRVKKAVVKLAPKRARAGGGSSARPSTSTKAIPHSPHSPNGAQRRPPTLQNPTLQNQVQVALSSLKRMSTQRDRENLTRFAISTNKFFGVSMSNMKVLAKRLGRNHELAAALWDSGGGGRGGGGGWYEARMLATLIDEPARVTPAQMERWCRDFDNWAICDTACFALFDRTPHAWAKVAAWSNRRNEFEKRAAFALLWSLTVHDKRADDEPFARGLLLIERAADDERNFVKKAVNMALRAIGKRSPALHAAAVAVAQRLAQSEDATPRWIGKDALRELTSPKMRAWSARRGQAAPASTR